MNNLYTKLPKGVTLLELLITLAIVAVLAAITIANMKSVKKPLDLVDNATNVIENILNQANSKSIVTNTPQEVCNLSAGNAGSYAVCSNTTTWENVNGNTFSNVIIQANLGTSGASLNNKIIYTQGLIMEKIILTIQYIENGIASNTCFNRIIIWPNGVVDVENQATQATCPN